MAFFDKPLCLYVLCALLVISKDPQILVANDKHGGMFCDAVLHAAPGLRGKIRGILARNRQRSGEHDNLAEEFAFRVAVSFA